MQAVSERSIHRHRFAILILALLLGAASPWLPPLALDVQFFIVLVPIALFGMSHGGADPLIIAQLKANHGRSNAAWLGGYLALMAVSIGVIVWQPELSLIGFLLLSMWHFGTTDVPFMKGARPTLTGWLSGSLPIVGPLAGHPEQVAILFGWLLQQDPSALQGDVLIAGRLLLAAWALGVCLVAMSSRPGRAISVIELCVLAAPMLLLPPLLAFAFYFCTVHSLRHFMLLMASQQRLDRRLSITGMARIAAPATLGAVLLGGLVWAGMQVWQPSLDMANVEMAWLEQGVRVIFWGLAVLTVPHALLVAIWAEPAAATG